MADFNEWRRVHYGFPSRPEERKAEKEQRKAKERTPKTFRLYYVHGRDRIAVEEIVDAVRERVAAPDLNRVSLSAAEVEDQDVWAALNQYALDTKEPRLVVVRDSEKIQNWDPLIPWLGAWREMQGTHALFVSNETLTKHDRDLPHMKAMTKSSSAIRIDCTLNGENAIEYLKTKAHVDRNTVMYLLAKTGNRIQPAVEALRKATIVGATVNEANLDLLVVPSPAAEFEDALIEFRKRAALQAADIVPTDDYGRIFGLLNQRLDVLLKLNQVCRVRKSVVEIHRDSNLDRATVDRYLGVARYYDRAKVRTCLQALNFLDSFVMKGERQGVLQTLVALW